MMLSDSGRQLPHEYWEMLQDGRQDEFYHHAVGFVLTSDHMWCSHEEVMTQLLPLFTKHYEGIDEVQSAMAEQLEQCIDCVTTYNSSKKNLDDEDLLEKLQQLDIKRIINALNKWNEQPDKLSVIFYEILHFPLVLQNAELNNLFTAAMIEVQKDNDLSFSGEKKVPGMYLLLMHPEVGLRFWAQKTISTWSNISSMEDFELVEPILEHCMHILQFGIFDEEQPRGKEFLYSRKEFWAGFSFLLKQFENDIFEVVIGKFPSIIDIIMNHLNENSTIFWHSLTCFLVLLSKMGPNMWEICSFGPGSVLRTLVEQCAKSHDEKIHKACFQLFGSLLDYLEKIDEFEFATQRDELLSFLSVQVSSFPHFSNTSKNMAITACYKILQQGTRSNPPNIPYGSVKKWGGQLVSHACSTSTATGMQAMSKLALSLLSDILYSATIQMRECVQNLLSNKPCPNDTDWWCRHLWTLLFAKRANEEFPLQLHLLIFRTYKYLALLDVSSVAEQNGVAFDVQSALSEYRADLYTHLSAPPEQKESILHGHEDVVSCTFFLLASPDKLVRASVSEFLVEIEGSSGGSTTTVIQSYAKLAPKALYEGMLATIKDAYYVLGVTNCTKSLDNIFFWIQKIIKDIQAIIKQGGIKSKSETGESIVLCEKSVAKNIVDYTWLMYEDTLKSVKLSNQPQLLCIRFFESFNEFMGLFATYDYPSSAKAKPPADDEVQVLDEPDGSIIQNHERWMKYFLNLGQSGDAAIVRRWLVSLVTIVNGFEAEYIKLPAEVSAVCLKILTKELGSGCITDAQRTDLAKRMPAVGGPVVGNIGMSWSSSLPSFDQAKSTIVSSANTSTSSTQSLPASKLSFLKAKAKSIASLPKKVEEKDDRPACYYGSLCYRKNPDHFKMYKHPPDNKTPQKPRPIPKAADLVDLTSSGETATSVPNTTKTATLPPKVPIPTKPTNTTTTTTTTTTTSSNNVPASKPQDKFKLNNDGSDSDSDTDGVFGKKTNEDVLADLAQDEALAQYKIRMWKERQEANNRQSKVLELPSYQRRRFGAGKEQTNTQPKVKARTLEDLYKTVLTWDYDNLSSHKDESKMQKVPKSFASAEDYINIFEPLLMEEILSQIERGKEESESVPIQMKVVSASRVDDFHMIDLKKVSATPQDTIFADHDIVLLYAMRKDKKAVKFSILGKTEKREKDKVDKVGIDTRVRLYLQTKGGFVSERAKLAQQELIVNAVWWVKRVMGLTTASREFAALNSCRSLPLLPSILQPADTSTSAYTKEPLPGVLSTVFKSKFNPSQLNAIEAGVATEGFALLQGPPGTGKTRTIIGLISALLQMPPAIPNNFVQRGYLAKKDAPTAKKPKIHVLVCAPSNAAVDEIVLRLTEGVWDSHGSIYKPSIVRVGNPAHVHVLARKFCLESIVDQKMAEEESEYNKERRKIVALKKKIEDAFTEKNQMESQINTHSKDLNTLRDDLSGDRVSSVAADELSLTTKLTDMHRRKDKIRDDITAMKVTEKQSARKLDQVSRDMMASILDDADIICATLSSSGADILSTLTHGFDAVVIDEAAQAIEVSSLIPLRYGVRKCIMVGDPNQLPATVMSTTATKYQYEQSLFQRMMDSGYHVHMLSVQYRMHPMIRSFPSKHFYEDKLTDGENITPSNYIQPYHEDPRFAPFVFYNLATSKETRGGSSLRNVEEANFAYSLVGTFFQNYSSEKNISIGIITPYKQQYHELRKLLLGGSLGKQVEECLEINTVDGFQGREKDIIIFSCVRAHSGGGIGFLSDIRRMNVALTRAKFSLLVIGHSDSLRPNNHWGNLIDDAVRRKCYTTVDNNFYKVPPTRVDTLSYYQFFPNATKPTSTSQSPLKTSTSALSPFKSSGGLTKSSSIPPPNQTQTQQTQKTGISGKRAIDENTELNDPFIQSKKSKTTTPTTPTSTSPTSTPSNPFPTKSSSHSSTTTNTTNSTNSKPTIPNPTNNNNNNNNNGPLNNSGGFKKKNYNPGKRQTILIDPTLTGGVKKPPPSGKKQQ